MSEGIIKSGRKQSFTVLYKSAIEDKRLPLDARGLLAIMVGLPEGWQYSVKGLAAYVGVSKDTIRRLLGKLEEVGYLTREQTHDENGHFAGNVYVLQDEAPPLSGNTDNGVNRQRLSRRRVSRRNRLEKNRLWIEIYPPIVPPRGTARS